MIVSFIIRFRILSKFYFLNQMLETTSQNLVVHGWQNGKKWDANHFCIYGAESYIFGISYKIKIACSSRDLL